ncbi:hypothetical protein ACFVYV_09375 [Streptomyces mirabilis]|uniref:hypothetical protein n=1 Tax=Streptomyces mirabilis TaxID=68239 RepID=UPI0036DD5B30
MDDIRVAIKGVREVSAALDKRMIASNEATRVALGKATSYTKTRIRGGMRGAPRWDRKGRDPVTGQIGVNLNRNPHVIRRSGGPGQLTGSLYRSIRKSKKPRLDGIGAYSAVVMAGGEGGFQNRYKATVEGTNPYFKPGVNKASPKVRGIFEASWAAAIHGNKIRR